MAHQMRPLKDLGPPTGKLNPQQLRFIEEYLVDPTNLTKAAIRAGYSIKSAREAGSRLMADPRIRKGIEEGQRDRSERIGLTQDRVIQELMLIAFANLKDIIVQNSDGTTDVDLKALSREHAAALGELNITSGKMGRSTKIKLADKIASLVKLGQHLGMFKDKVEHSGTLTLEQLVSGSFEPEPESEPESEVDRTR